MTLPFRSPVAALAKLALRSALSSRIASGPFAGMKYVSRSHASALGAKLVGTYELELHETIRAITSLNISNFVDIGAAEGYYAVGLLLNCNSSTTLVAFEAGLSGQRLCGELAELNGVSSRMRVRGFCSPESLNDELQTGEHPALVLCDTEGFEATLLDPAVVTGLQTAYVLVELHEFAVAGVGELLRERFRTTHRIVEICTRERSRSDFPLRAWWFSILPDAAILALMAEHRGREMSWLWMTPDVESRKPTKHY